MAAIVLINDNWEQVKDLPDIVRIVKENIGDEFAREVERICGDYEFKISELEDEIDYLQGRVYELEKCGV